MKNNKTYLELANERHEQSKQKQKNKYIIELSKIEAQNQRHKDNIQYKQWEHKQKHKTGIIGTITGIITFIILLIIMVVFAMIITKI